MAKRLGKRFTVINIFIRQRTLQSLDTMWTFILLQYMYMSTAMAQTDSPKHCPKVCECLGSIVKCNQRDLIQVPGGLNKDLTGLDLSGNNISSINNDAFRQFSKLVQLDLSNNRITKINNGTFQNSSLLFELNLNNNKITSIDLKALTDLPSLQILKLNGNGLTSVPNLHLKALTILDLSENKLETIPAKLTLRKMTPVLQVLKLSNNKIKSIKDATFYGLNKLKKLYLDSNLLTNVNVNWLFGLDDLVKLYLQHNRITNVSSESWDSCCSKLEVLNLAKNKLKRLLVDHVNLGNGGRFAKLKSLVSLNLSSNEIFEIADNSFQSLKKLQLLDLSNNKLSWTAYDSNGTFTGLRSLIKLNLRSNEITSVVKVMFEQLPAIKKLDMRDNRIQEVTRDAFKPMRSLTDLRMNTNFLYCGCKLRWFSQWLSTKQLSQKLRLKCGQPKKLSGREFPSIALKDLVCDKTPRPGITEHPKTQTAFKGNNVQFSCTIKNGSIAGITIVWKKDMKDVDTRHSETRKYTQATDNNFVIYKSVLRLYDVDKSRDNGVYQCVIDTRVGEMKSRKARLEVFVPVRFTSKPGDLVTTPGGTVRFNCSASGDPPPSIYFRRDKNSVLLKDRLDLNDETFIIKNVTIHDLGLYRCFAKSRAGFINTTFQLNIIDKPVPARPMLDKMSLLYDTVIFTCATRTWAIPKFMWFKDDNPVDFTSSNVKHRRQGNTEYLMIESAEYSDAGVYKCRVSNYLGTSELTSRLKVVQVFSEVNPKSPSDREGIDHRTFVVSIVFTAVVSMVFTTLIVIHTISRRRRRRGCSGNRYKTHAQASDSFTTPTQCTSITQEEQQYMQMEAPSPSESPRSSSTFVTSTSQTPSDSNIAQTSGSDSGSTKGNHEGSFDGRQSSGVCSMNSSTSSLASTTNHRNTYPFSTKTFLYPRTTTCLYDASDDSASCGAREHGHSRRTLLLKYNDQPPARRKQKSSRSRERHADKRKKGVETERLYSKPSDEKTDNIAENNTTAL